MKIFKVLGLLILTMVSLILIVGLLFVNLSPQFGGSPTEEQTESYSKTGHYKEGVFVNKLFGHSYVRLCVLPTCSCPCMCPSLCSQTCMCTRLWTQALVCALICALLCAPKLVCALQKWGYASVDPFGGCQHKVSPYSTVPVPLYSV